MTLTDYEKYFIYLSIYDRFNIAREREKTILISLRYNYITVNGLYTLLSAEMTVFYI